MMELSSLKPHPSLVALLSQSVGGRYRIDRMVAIGGMAAVYEGCQESVGRRVAVKILLPELQDKQEYRERFQREVDILCRLDHPNCLRLLDAGTTEGGFPYHVTDFIDGRELAACLGTPLAVDRATRITGQLLDALEHIHAQGVVHRDLKPSNVLIGTDRDGLDVVRIVDFGVAKDLRSAPSDPVATQKGVVFGTPGFMSPEQVAGQELDYRSDLYALGLLMVTMLRGRAPLDHLDVASMVEVQKEGWMPALDEVPEHLSAVLSGLLAKEPRARYGSARVAADALRRALTPAPAPIGVAAALTLGGGADVSYATLRGHLEGGVRSPKRVMATGVGIGIAMVVAGVVASAAVRHPVPVDAEDWVEATPEITFAHIDGLIAQGEVQTASALLEEKLGDGPEGGAFWRQGQIATRLGRDDQALERYERALAADTSLARDPTFVAEFRQFLESPALEHEALTIAVAHLGHQVDDVFIERLNRPQLPLDYTLRHHLLDRVADGDFEEDVDVVLNVELDLRQAAFAPRPCVAYAQALAALEAQPPHPRLLDTLAQSPPPQIQVAEDEAICAQLPVLREQVLRRTSDGSTAEGGLDGTRRASLRRLIRRG